MNKCGIRHVHKKSPYDIRDKAILSERYRVDLYIFLKLVGVIEEPNR